MYDELRTSTQARHSKAVELRPRPALRREQRLFNVVKRTVAVHVAPPRLCIAIWYRVPRQSNAATPPARRHRQSHRGRSSRLSAPVEPTRSPHSAPLPSPARRLAMDSLWRSNKRRKVEQAAEDAVEVREVAVSSAAGLTRMPRAGKEKRRLTLRSGVAQIGFGGCGGMYNYFLGVASVLQEEFDLTDVIFSGVSAGCFPAMVLALGLDAKEFFFKDNICLIEHASTCSIAGLGKWIPLTRKSVLSMLPEDAYARLGGKLYFSLTEVPSMRNHLLTEWESNEDMVDGMLCSAHVPLYTTSLAASYRGKRFVDGGLSNNHPVAHPDEPHKVFQIWKWRWISPSWILVTTDAAWATELFRKGREDALRNLHEVDEAFF